jgi:hypothetical protein
MNSVNEPNKLQHNERSKYSDQSEIRVLTTGGTLAAACYLVVIDDIYAGLYIYNQNNFIQSRKHLLGKDSINDFFDTFHKHLEIANEPDSAFGRILNIKEGHYDL